MIEKLCVSNPPPLTPSPPSIPIMEKASDVFFLDVSALRKLRPGKHSSRFDHSMTTSDLVKQAPLISSLKELVEVENEAIRKGGSPEKATKMVRSIENELGEKRGS